MKKEYIKPATEMVTVETESFIAASGDFFFDGDNGTGGIFDEDATGPAKSKDHVFDIWDGDEE